MNLKGKKLLLTGGSASADEIKAFADKHGIILAATGLGDDTKLKAIAAETYNVDTIDVEAMIDLCKKIGADGIFAGGNEPNIGAAIEVTEALGMPYYVNKEQFELNRNKNFFKATCKKYGLNVPKEFKLNLDFKQEDLNEIIYPVVVKPIDSCGGNGVAICETQAQLKEKFEIAVKASPSGRALVEEYVMGDEITAVYTLKDGVVSLSCLKDKYISHDHPFIASQADVLVTPSKFLPSFAENESVKIKNLLLDMGFKNGTMFFQGIAQKDRIVMFEMGCRMSGGMDYRNISKVNKINFLEMLLCHSLTGEMGGYDIALDNAFFPSICVSMNMWAHGGVVGKLEGLEEVSKLDGVTNAEYLYHVGDEIPEDGSLKQKFFRTYINAPTREEAAKIVDKVQSTVKVFDKDGNNMKYIPFDLTRML